MSSRPAIHITVREPADSGTSPNRYIGQITAQIRLHFPPTASEREVLSALERAYQQTVKVYAEEYRDPR